MTVIDLSKRLPGPYATKRLLELGSKVIRIEDSESIDPFQSSEMKIVNPLFYEWYINLNSGKEIKSISLSKDIVQFQSLLSALEPFSIIIHSLSDKKEQELIADKMIKDKNLICLSIKASKQDPHLHDLNILALQGLLNYHSANFANNERIAPPFLPIAGISFGHTIAEKALWLKMTNKSGRHTIYLEDEIQGSLGLLKGSVNKALHNGLFPCYQIYRTKDQKYIALALIEERFWLEFLNISKLVEIGLTLESRFSTDQKVFDQLVSFFLKHDGEELTMMFKTLSALTIFHPN